MNDYLELGKISVNANISYTNISKKYIIGLMIGNVYTILEESFDEKSDAVQFLLDNFYYNK